MRQKFALLKSRYDKLIKKDPKPETQEDIDAAVKEQKRKIEPSRTAETYGDTVGEHLNANPELFPEGQSESLDPNKPEHAERIKRAKDLAEGQTNIWNLERQRLGVKPRQSTASTDSTQRKREVEQYIKGSSRAAGERSRAEAAGTVNYQKFQRDPESGGKGTANIVSSGPIAPRPSVSLERDGQTRRVRTTTPANYPHLDPSKAPTPKEFAQYHEERWQQAQQAQREKEAEDIENEREKNRNLGSGMDGSARSMVADSAPTPWNRGASRAEQTGRTKFSEASDNAQAKAQEKNTKIDEARRKYFGPLADEVGARTERGATQQTPRTQPTGVSHAVDFLVGETKPARWNQRDLKQRNKYLMLQLGHVANFFDFATPLKSTEEQRARVAGHHEAQRKLDTEKGEENKLRQGKEFTTFHHGAAIAQHDGKNIAPTQHKPAAEGLTDEQIAAARPDLVELSELGQNPAYTNLMEQDPTLGQGSTSGPRLGKLLRGGMTHPGWNNAQNTVRELYNSGRTVKTTRDPVEGQRGSVMPATDKTTTTSLSFPAHGKELYFEEHAKPSLNEEAYQQEVGPENQPTPPHVQAAHAEKTNLENALLAVRQSLSNAISTHAKGDIDGHMAHLNAAKSAAAKAGQLAHNETDEAIGSHKLLSNLSNNIDYATKYPQKATKDGETTYRDALNYLKNTTASHYNNLQAIGPAFKNEHVERKPILTAAALDEMDEAAKNPETYKPPVQSTSDAFVAENPYKYTAESQRQAEVAHSIVYSDNITKPDEFLRVHSKKLAPEASDDSLTSEMKNFIAANHLNYYTHPHEFAQKPVHPLSEEFLSSVPVTQIHNYFDPNDKTMLGGMPARQFAEKMALRIVNHGTKHLTPTERHEFNGLDEKYNNGTLTDQEKERHNELLNQITHHGLASPQVMSGFSHNLRDAWNQARFIAASRQQRGDYIGDISSHALVSEANQLAQSDDPSAFSKLKDIKKQLSDQSWHPMVRKEGAMQGEMQISPNAVRGSSWFRKKAKRHVDGLIQDAVHKYKAKMGKSMNTPHHEKLTKCKNLISRAKEKLNKAIIPQGKYIRTADGTLVLVDLHSNAVQQQQKQVAQAQQKNVPAPPAAQPKPATPPAPVMPKPPVQSKPEIPPQPQKQPAAVAKPPAPKQPLPEPPKPSLGQKPAESIGDVARKIKAESAMSVFGYTPKK